MFQPYLSDQVAIAREAAAENAAVVVRPNEDEIGAAIVRLLKDDKARAELSRNGQIFAAKRFSVESVGSALAAQYKAILETN